MTDLSDDERAALVEARSTAPCHVNQQYPRDEHIWRAAGRYYREQDAKICEQKVTRIAEYGGRWGGYGQFYGPMSAAECAAAIRKRIEGTTA